MKPADMYDLGAAPVNKDAYRVLSRGFQWIPNLPERELVFDVPPNLDEITKPAWNQRPEDLTGRKVGRLTVMGWWGRHLRPDGSSGGAQSQKWLCRCQCGRYCVRKAKAIKRALNPDEKCQECYQLEIIKKRASGLFPDAHKEKETA